MDSIHSQRTVSCVECQQVRIKASSPEYLEPALTRQRRRIVNKNHMYDATEIFRSLGGHKKETFIKLGFYLLSFFYYLYRCVLPLLL